MSTVGEKLENETANKTAWPAIERAKLADKIAAMMAGKRKLNVAVDCQDNAVLLANDLRERGFNAQPSMGLMMNDSELAAKHTVVVKPRRKAP